MANGVKPRACVLKADGTNCEIETAFAFEEAGAQATILPVNRLRWGEARLSSYDILVVPGGFSYGDDVISGKVLAVELMSFLAEQIADFAAAGKPVLGICNGFQVLVRTGLLPFGEVGRMSATLALNECGRFECRWVNMVAEGGSELVSGLPGRISMPVAHQEGRFYASKDDLDRIEEQGLVALRYVDAAGEPTMGYPNNPNGSLGAIAGVTDPKGRILGLMPHPERNAAPYHHPQWRRDGDEEPHGLALIKRLVQMA